MKMYLVVILFTKHYQIKALSIEVKGWQKKRLDR